jgi:hypothetical protein
MPKVCAPLWIAGVGERNQGLSSSPVVAGGVVYVGSNEGRLFAFDAAGTTSCSGIPKYELGPVVSPAYQGTGVTLQYRDMSARAARLTRYDIARAQADLKRRIRAAERFEVRDAVRQAEESLSVAGRRAVLDRIERERDGRRERARARRQPVLDRINERAERDRMEAELVELRKQREARMARARKLELERRGVGRR